MGSALSIEPTIQLASREIDEKLKLVNALAAELMNVASGHGDAKLQAIQIVVNDAVKLLSKEMDDKMQATNVMAINTMLLVTSEMDKKIQLVDVVIDRQRRKLLSSAVAFMYFILLMAYTLYPPPSVGTGTRGANFFVGLQFLILGVWISDLVGGVNLPFVQNSTNQDRFFILALVMGFLGFVFCRAGDHKGVKLGDNPGLGKEVGQPIAQSQRALEAE